MNALVSFLSRNEKGVLPIAGAVLLAVWKEILPSMKELNGKARRMRALHDGAKRVEFWKSWLEAVAAGDSATEADKRIAETEFAAAANAVNQVFMSTRDVCELTAAEFRSYKGGVNAVRKFLMLYREPSDLARGWRWFGYLLSVAMVAEAYGLNQIPIFRELREAFSDAWEAQFLPYASYLPAAVMWWKARVKFQEREDRYLAERSLAEQAQQERAAAVVEESVTE